MIMLQPEFDCSTATWFIAGRKEEASSLRELKAKLGSGYRLDGYYPNGWKGKTIWSKEQTRKQFTSHHVQVQIAPNKNRTPAEKVIVGARVTRRAPAKRDPSMFVDWNDTNIKKLRELVAKGYGDTEIGRAFNTTRNAIIGKRNRLGI